MADGLFMTETSVRARAYAGRGWLGERLPMKEGEGGLEALVAAQLVEVSPVEEIYHRGIWHELEQPRTWELNGWWEALFGAIPMPPAEEAPEEKTPDSTLDVGVQAHPVGLQSADNQVRLLLERGLLTQKEPLYRLRVSVFEQNRALGILREGWQMDGDGQVVPPPGAEGLPGGQMLGDLPPRRRRVQATSLTQLLSLGLVIFDGERYRAA